MNYKLQKLIAKETKQFNIGNAILIMIASFLVGEILIELFKILTFQF